MTLKVEMLLAFVWYCPGCRYLNFVAPTDAGLSDDERETVYRRLNDLEDWQELPDDWEREAMVLTPSEVTCKACRKEFPVHVPGEDE